MLRTYQPKKRQRSKVHGFRKRMSTADGRKGTEETPRKGKSETYSLSANKTPRSSAPTPKTAVRPPIL